MDTKEYVNKTLTTKIWNLDLIFRSFIDVTETQANYKNDQTVLPNLAFFSISLQYCFQF